MQSIIQANLQQCSQGKMHAKRVLEQFGFGPCTVRKIVVVALLITAPDHRKVPQIVVEFQKAVGPQSRLEAVSFTSNGTAAYVYRCGFVWCVLCPQGRPQDSVLPSMESKNRWTHVSPHNRLLPTAVSHPTTPWAMALIIVRLGHGSVLLPILLA